MKSSFASTFASFTGLLALGALAGCSAPAPTSLADGEVGSAESPLVDAPIDDKHTFNVGVCQGTVAADGTCGGSHCSGTLVAPNVVLTAQHCINGIEYAEKWCDSSFTGNADPDAAIQITTGSSSKLPGNEWYGVKEVLVPGANLCRDDIALLILSARVPSKEARPVAMAIGRDIDRRPPSHVAVVGRGAIDSTYDPETYEYSDDDGGLRRRILQNIPVVCTPGTAAGCDVVDFSSTFNTPQTMFAIGRSLEAGDSGTAIFDQRTFNVFPTVLGVASSITFGPDGKSITGLVTRLDTHTHFLLSGLFKAFLTR